MTTDRVVPAYPFEGALFWFLAGGRPHSQSHPYYRVLYGNDPHSLSTKAAAVASLYPEISLAPADASLPDHGSYLRDGIYYHPDLRIGSNLGDNEWSDENLAVAAAALSSEGAPAFLNSNPALRGGTNLHTHFLARTSLQIRLAAKTKATLIGDSFFRHAYSFVAPWVRELLGEPTTAGQPRSKIAIEERTLDVVGLDFSPADLGAFAAMRASKEIAKYADSFRKAVEDASLHDQLEPRLLGLMAEAMDSGDVAKHVSRGFQTAGSMMTAVGLVPAIAAPASALEAVADVAGRTAAGVAARKDWYLLGAKMKEIAIREALERHKRGASR